MQQTCCPPRRRPVIRSLSCPAILLLLAIYSPCSAQTTGGKSSPVPLTVDIVAEGSSSRSSRSEATKQLPLQKLSAPNRQKVQSILKSVSLYRRLPTITLATDPDVYIYFVTHPDVAVSIWRVMEISKFQMWQTGPNTYEADSSDGSLGVVDILYRSPGQNLILCEGQYKSPLLSKPIHARMLMHLQTKYTRRENGETFATHHIDLFVNLPSQSVETVAKIISPISNVIADRNFREISLFAHMMSVAMQRQPGWVERIADRIDGVLKVRRNELLELTARVFVAARKRQLAENKPVEQISFDDIIKPLQDAAKAAEGGAVFGLNGEGLGEGYVQSAAHETEQPSKRSRSTSENGESSPMPAER